MRFLKWLPAAIVATCALSGSAMAQPISNVDSIRVLPANFTIPNPAVSTNFKVALFIKNATTLGAIAVPLKYGGHPNLRVDVSVNTVAHPGVSQGPAGASANWTLRTSFVDSSANKGILIGYVSFGAFPASNDTLAYVHFAYTGSGVSGAVSLDSGVVNNQHLGVTDVLANEFIPRWSKGAITIGTPQPTIGLNPTSMVFNGTIGTANPAPQPLAITNTGAGTLSWTAITTQPWLSVNPTSGTGNGNPNVSVNLAGLAAGTHTGWVIVSDPAASNTPESAFVTLNLARPTLAAAPTSLTFNGVIDNPNPPAINVQLSASQGAAIAWTGTKSQPWLSFNPASGTTPNNLSASVNIAGLTAGIHRDTIVITSANASNSPLRIPVTLVLTAPPAIALVPQSLSFSGVQGGANPPPDTVLLSNSGQGLMDFSATASDSWLSVTPGAGSAPFPLQISVDLAGLTAGSYTGYVEVTSSVGVNSPETVTVSLEVSSAPPFLSVAPTSASFSANEGDLIGNPATTAVIINNTGSGTLAWSILGKDSSWVQLSKLSGGGPDTLLVSVNPAGRMTGTYQEVFQIADPSAEGSPVDFTVTMEVLPGPPTIAVAPGQLEFSAVLGSPAPAAQALSITNVGGSLPLNWTATHGVTTWLLLSSASGTAPSNVNVSVDLAGLGLGLHHDTILVASDGATNTPVSVPVTLNIVPAPPTIDVSPDSLAFVATLGDPNPSAQSLGIANVGGGTLNWSLSTVGAWLSAGPGSGTAPSNVDVNVNLAGLAPGTYVGRIDVAGTGATNSPVSVPVVLVLNDLPPALAVEPTSLLFSAQEGGPNPAAQFFSISNTGGGDLLWNVSSAASWISQLDPVSGTNDDDVSVTLDVSGLVSGTYVDSVLVDAGAVGGSPQYVLVTLELAAPPPPQIVLTPGAFSFTALLGGPNPAGQDLTITNGGGRVLEWTAAQGEGWLTLSETAGTAPSVTTLNVDIAGLGVGVYYDTVVVSSDSATNSPQTATVELHIVDNPPALSVAPLVLNFEKVKGEADPACQSVQISNTGAGELNWTATKKASWLILSSASGTAPASLDVCMMGPSLVAGTYRDTIVISSPGALNSPQRVIVTFVVKSVAKPSIVLQPPSLNFNLTTGTHSSTQCTYVFINGNGGRLVWRAHTDAPWIDVTPDSCNISHPLCVTVSSAGLVPGTYCDSVAVAGDASNSPQYLTVCLNVTDGGEQPILATDPTLFEVTVPEGSAVQFRQLSILNVGAGSLTWSIDPGFLSPWLSANPTAGAAPGSTDLQLNPFGLLPGVYADTVVVASAQAANSPVRVPVFLTITGGGEEPGDSVRVGTDSASPGSIAVVPVFFDNSRPLFGVTVPLTWSGTGVWADSVSFEGSRATDSDIKAASVDTALREIRIGLIPSALDPIAVGSGLLATVYFTVADWAPNQVVELDTVTTSQPAISLGFVDTSTSEYVPGFRMGHIMVSGAEPAILSVVPDSLLFTGAAGGANPPAQVVHVNNLGGSYLTYQASESVPWLSINPASGQQNDSVFFTVNLAGLSQDMYFGTVRFISPEAFDTVDVVVVLNVGPQVNPPVMVLSPSSLNFSMAAGVLPASQAITVLNTGGGSLSWTATKTQTWFSVLPNTGGAGQVVTVSITNAALAVGTYQDTITFSDPGASNSPRKAGVTLVVTGPAKPDTVRVAHVFAEPGDTVLVPVTCRNTFEVSGITLPFKYSGTGVKLLTGDRGARCGPGIFAIFANEEIDTVDQTGLFGYISFGAGMAPGDGEILVMKFVIAPDAPDQVIQIDTTTLPPSNKLVLNDPLASEIFPDFIMGTITVGSGGGSSIWVEDVTGEAGDEVEVEVYVNNTSPVDGLTLPLRLTSPDARIVSVDFSGMPSEMGVPSFIVYNDQLFTLKVDWSGTLPLAPGSGPVARFKIELDAQAASQLVYVDTAGEYGLRLAGGSQNVEVPSFGRGTITLQVGTSAGDPSLPWVFGLEPNFPNPFNPETRIHYSLSAANEVRLEVFNTLGRRVATLVEGFKSAGEYTVTWDGRDAHGSSVPSGVYLYRLTAGTETALRKMTLLK